MIGLVAYVLAALLRAPEHHALARAQAEKERDRLRARLIEIEGVLAAARPLVREAELRAREDQRAGAGTFWDRCRHWNVAHGNEQRKPDA